MRIEQGVTHDGLELVKSYPEGVEILSAASSSGDKHQPYWPPCTTT